MNTFIHFMQSKIRTNNNTLEVDWGGVVFPHRNIFHLRQYYTRDGIFFNINNMPNNVFIIFYLNKIKNNLQVQTRIPSILDIFLNYGKINLIAHLAHVTCFFYLLLT
ncbi:hypothetical protein ACJX0J_010086, partial [Zea mays]